MWNYSHHLDATIELLKDLQKRYPVIYYLHGGTGNQREATWMVRRIHSAISRGEMEPVIIGGGMKIRLFVGTEDKLYDDGGIPITSRFHNELDSLGIPHSFTIVPGAGHSPHQLFAPGGADYDVDFWNRAFGTQQ